MERRRFIERLVEGFLLTGLILIAGCRGKPNPKTFGNQEKLWDLVSKEGEIEEPTELSYAKETPAFYRDASMGKADPNFVPRVTGG